MAKVSLTIDQAVARFADNWTNYTPGGTFGFMSSDATDAGFVRISQSLKPAIAEAVALWADVANLNIQQSASTYTNSGTILFAGSSNEEYASTGPDRVVHLNTVSPAYPGGPPSFTDVGLGSYDFATLIHEIGHAFGLEHPGNYNGGSPSYAVDAEYKQDTLQYTVMSYFDESNTGADFGLYSDGSSLNPVTPMLHDIAAVQKLFGANMTTRTGNTVYGFNSNTNRLSFHLDSASEKAAFCIWDAGGNDTFDLSGYSNTQVINLVPMTFSSTGGLKMNMSIARGCTIENAIGGSGIDTIIGNGIANALNGRAGNDRLSGGAGADKLTGGAGIDTFVFKSLADTGVTGTTRDVITDYQHLTDWIDLSGIDAKTTASGDQAFMFIGNASFHHVSGELHARIDASSNTVVEGDVNGDGLADFQIQINGIKPITAADFVL